MKSAIVLILLGCAVMKVLSAMETPRSACAADFLIRGVTFDRCVTDGAR